jgi:hypothetical protein
MRRLLRCDYDKNRWVLMGTEKTPEMMYRKSRSKHFLKRGIPERRDP